MASTITRYHQLTHKGRIVVARGASAQALLDYAMTNHLTIEVSGRRTKDDIETVDWMALP